MLEANRPFGVNDVVQKLAPRYDKGVVQSMLDALERQGVLRSKAVVAQQKAYWPDQSKIKATSMADIRDMSCDVRDAKCDAKEADEDASFDLPEETGVLFKIGRNDTSDLVLRDEARAPDDSEERALAQERVMRRKLECEQQEQGNEHQSRLLAARGARESERRAVLQAQEEPHYNRSN